MFAVGRNESSSFEDDNRFSTKIFLLEENIFCLVTGLTADAQVIIDHARIEAQNFKKNFQELITLNRILGIISDNVQRVTQVGGKRPFGTSLLIGGFDNLKGYQIYRTEPTGNFTQWNAVAIGSYSNLNQNILNEEFNPEMPIEKAMKLILKVFYKRQKKKLSANMEIFTIKSDDEQRICVNFLTHSEINFLSNK